MIKGIIDFLEKQKIATICCNDADNHPYCFNCFYAFDSSRQLLYFKSSLNTFHGPLLQQAPVVAGTILPDKINTIAIKGVQYTGIVLPESDPLSSQASAVYHQKYPFALAKPGTIWTIQLQTIKMTDNTITFGKKLLWERQEAAITN